MGCPRGFPNGLAVKNLPANAGDTGDTNSIPGRSPGGGHDNPLQYSCQEKPMDRGTWWATVHLVTKSRTRLSMNVAFLNFVASLVAQTVKNLFAMHKTWVQSLGQEDLLENSMAKYSSILTWKIPWAEEPRGLQSIGPQRVGHN